VVKRIQGWQVSGISLNDRMSEKDAEIARLRQENQRLLAEREILKKATI
jgi:transposase-like protein